MAPPELVDRLLPEYDVSDTVGRVVAADAESSWRALVDADLMEVGRRRRLVGILGFARIAPALAARVLRGEDLPKRPPSLRLEETTKSSAVDGGWVLLGKRENQELALGLVGKFWRPVIEYAEIEAEEFPSFSEPGWAKTVYDLRVSQLGERRTLVTGTMRTATTDDAARRRFRRYWTLGVGSGAHLLVAGLLDLVAERAEEAIAEPVPATVVTT
jgi:hypothetical protein